MGRIRSILNEIQKQLLSTSSFRTNPFPSKVMDYHHMEKINAQIEKAIRDQPHRIIFLMGPFGSGKTTNLQYFIQNHAQLRYKYFSAIKLNSLDFAFLHLTHWLSRFIVIAFSVAASLYLVSVIPPLGAFPLLVIIVSLFMKNFGNLVYILHETCDSIFQKNPKFVIIEDLERSSLNTSDQWALLANLWHYKRTYFVTLGYDPEEMRQRLKLIEYVIKLGGTLIEIALNPKANYDLIKYLDPDFPFQLSKKELIENVCWLSLFTFREMLVIREQVILRMQRDDSGKSSRKKDPVSKKLKYVHVCFEIFLEKLNLAHRGFTFIEKTSEFRGVNKKNLPDEQAHFLRSFFNSIEPKLGIKIIE